MRTISHFINGQSVARPGAVTSPVYDPSTGQAQARLEHGDAAILAEAVAHQERNPAVAARRTGHRPELRPAEQEVKDSRARMRDEGRTARLITGALLRQSKRHVG
jgi:acyl-CoA reductase-like NAD-dependent aldehyde dehydrogenase